MSLWKSIVAIAFLISMPGVLKAEEHATAEKEGPTEINSAFDFSWQRNSNGQNNTDGRFFDNRNNVLQMNLIEVGLKKKVGEFLLKGEFGFGADADDLATGGLSGAAAASASVVNDPTRNVLQATVTYTPKSISGLSITAGKMFTHIGLETVYAKDNWQYSRGLNYVYGMPLQHQGLALGYELIPSKLTLTGYVYNAWASQVPQVTNSGAGAYADKKSSTLGASLSYTPAPGTAINFNYIGGAESANPNYVRELYEANGSYDLNTMFSLAWEYVSGVQRGVLVSPNLVSGNWTGYGIYAKAQITKWYSLSPRYEIFDDSDKGVALSSSPFTTPTTPIKVTGITVTNKFRLQAGLEAVLEYRLDSANKSSSFFQTQESTATKPVAADHEDTLAIALLANF